MLNIKVNVMDDIQPIFSDLEFSGPIVIAGPCSAETQEQVLSTARQLAAAGIKIFRAGIWKPRTKPGGFEGIGVDGLPWLQQVKEQTGMLTATEVANRRHVMEALNAGIDLLWIGARTSANPFAMQEVADALRERKAQVPVLVKNPVTPDLELWIGALQRLYNAGIRRLGVIHRGFTAYGHHIYRNMPLWQVPIELRRRLPQIPIICDPSHIGGKRELVGPLSQQALDIGMEGLMIECHCDPDCAWSDKAQQLTPEVLQIVLESLTRRENREVTESLSQLRRQIDEADNELLDVLSRRMQISRQISEYKKIHGMAVLQTARYDQLLKSRLESAQDLDLSQDFVQILFQAVHEESIRHQIAVMNQENKE